MSEPESTKLDTAAKVLSVVGLIVLAYVAGAYTARFEIFPYPQLLAPPFKALEAVERKRKLIQRNPKKSTQWHRVENWKSGVVAHDDEKSVDGFTFFTSAHASAAFLIDEKGAVVHEWGKKFGKAFPETPHLSDPVPEHKISWADAHLFPNGDVIGAYAADGDTPYAYGLVKLNKNSEIIWTWEGHPHHDFDVQSDGSIWLLDQQFRKTSKEPIPNLPDWNNRILEDFAVKLSPDGEELKRIRLVDIFTKHHGARQYRQWFEREHKWDILHPNDIDVIGEDFAEHHYFAEPGYLMISSRALSSISVLNPETEKIVWTTRGFWKKQHDPDALPNGDILIFDNQGYRGPGGSTQVATFDPQSLRIKWSFHGTSDRRFHCTWWGKQSPLSNGNVLIADSLNGRILEVTRDNEIVWEWHTPSIAKFKGKEYAPNIKAPVARIAPSYLEFEPTWPAFEESLLRVETKRFREE